MSAHLIAWIGVFAAPTPSAKYLLRSSLLRKALSLSKQVPVLAFLACKKYVKSNSRVLVAFLLCIAGLFAFGRALLSDHVTTGQSSSRHESVYVDSGTVSFVGATAILSPQTETSLRDAASTMAGNPDLHLRMEGYTELHQIDASHDVLSQQRSAALREYLLHAGIQRII